MSSGLEIINKKKACAYVGIESLAYKLPEDTTQEELLDLINRLNSDEKVNGILVQLPLPKHIDEQKVIQLLKRSGVEIAGKNCVVLGCSNIVGKPMALLMLRENATVTICHSQTHNLREITKQADLLIVAVGKPRFVDESYVREGAVVIDVGIHRDENNKLCGDVDFEKVAPHTSAITPVPGGVGPMTIAMLMNNCLTAVE